MTSSPRDVVSGARALLYDVLMGAAERAVLARWRRRVAGAARGCVLEIGAGTGLDFPHFRPGARVVATEPDLGMLARAGARMATATVPLTLVAAGAEALPFRDATFDAAVVSLALCTIPQPEQALHELHRVLRAGGRLHLLEHVRVEHPGVARLQTWLTPMWRRVAGGCHLDRPTVRLVQQSGFEVQVVHPHVYGLFVELEAKRTRERRPHAVPVPRRPARESRASE